MSSQAASKSSGRFSSDSVHCAPIRIRMYDGTTPISSVIAALPAAEDRDRHGEQRPDQQHRAEDVQEEREVDLVGPDRGQHAQAPGLKIMRTRTMKTTTLEAVWKSRPRRRCSSEPPIASVKALPDWSPSQ